jgi:four helix bundle protein
MAGVRTPTELDVYKLSDELARRVREVVDRAPFRRHQKLRQQMEEAAESPCSNIEEGFSRYLPLDNARFVRIAAGSLAELIRHLNRALARQLISPKEHSELRTLAKRALGAAVGYIVYLQTAQAPHLPKKRRPPRLRRRKREPGTDEPRNP